ncbi:hypothetical protein EMCRGX_G002879 [Ephydatia muelleri]
MDVSTEEVLNCAIPKWYDNLKAVTIPSVFIPLPEDFVEYLRSDGIILPRGCDLPQMCVHGDSDDESGEVDGDQQDDWSEGEGEVPEFTDLLSEIERGIAILGGAVVPKLNWSAPKDATWIISSNTLRCTCASEVLLLLKSSDFVAHDLSRVFKYCTSEVTPAFQYMLCLRQWRDIHPSGEFRCFVRHGRIVGISQRHYTQHFDFVVSHKDQLSEDMMEFFTRYLKGRFCNTNYVVDVFRTDEGAVRLMDFNPFCPMTDPLLFTWEELARLDTELPVVRVVESPGVMRPSDLYQCRLPKVVLQTPLNTKQWRLFLQSRNHINRKSNIFVIVIRVNSLGVPLVKINLPSLTHVIVT